MIFVSVFVPSCLLIGRVASVPTVVPLTGWGGAARGRTDPAENNWS